MTIDPGRSADALTACGAGNGAVSGGYVAANAVVSAASVPITYGDGSKGWRETLWNSGAAAVNITPYAVCAAP